MPFNLIKEYSALLELDHLNPGQRIASLKGVFDRDIRDNNGFNFRTKRIYPVKIEADAMSTLFTHLTCHSIEIVEENGNKYKRREYEALRSKRLHWIKHHIEEKRNVRMEVFSVEERIDGKDKIRTYIYDLDESYVIILEPQKNPSYYLITAYYINEVWGKKAMAKRLKKRLPEIY